MKKIVIFAFAALLLAGCGDKKADVIFRHGECVQLFPDATNGDEYLMEMTFEDFDLDTAMYYAEQLHGQADPAVVGKCSSVWNPAGYHGRNLDFYVNTLADVVLHMAAGEGRYASVGMSTCNPRMTLEHLTDGTMSEAEWATLPLTMTDGINENGVSVNINVVPANESTPVTGTHPEGCTLSATFVVRYLLDNARSAEHAKELLRELNVIGDPQGTLPFEYHWMVSDATRCFVAEIWNNEMVILPGQDIMTNFFHSQTMEVDPYGEGHERYAILQAHYDEGATMEGMMGLMQRVWYSQAYSTDIDPVWYSEFASAEDSLNYLAFVRGDKVMRERFQQMLERVGSAYQSLDYQKSVRAADNPNWYTTHTVVFDQHRKTFSIVEQENAGSVHTFGMMSNK